VEVNDYKDMAEQVERLLQDNKLFKNITKNAYETLKEYSWENVKTKILPILGQ
jgi:glycosyltransferase involved in cell wall biosynthesis